MSFFSISKSIFWFLIFFFRILGINTGGLEISSKSSKPLCAFHFWPSVFESYHKGKSAIMRGAQHVKINPSSTVSEIFVSEILVSYTSICSAVEIQFEIRKFLFHSNLRFNNNILINFIYEAWKLPIIHKRSYATSVKIQRSNWVYINMLLPRIQHAGVSKALKYGLYFEPMMKYLNELKQTANLLKSLVT